MSLSASRPVNLVIPGGGPDYAELCGLYRNTDGVKFLGCQREIMAFYTMCGCSLIPARFPGESYPLTIIEAILMERPVVAAVTGEIRRMIERGGVSAGIVVPYVEENGEFIDIVAAGMQQMLDDGQHARLASGAARIKRLDDFGKLVSQYERRFREAAQWDDKR
ncbi:MAG: glycosyltransferase [Beijerinckiaceae bacterium]|nr:glycosyltransferase [Beijerinckiaceae bacterium]